MAALPVKCSYSSYFLSPYPDFKYSGFPVSTLCKRNRISSATATHQSPCQEGKVKNWIYGGRIFSRQFLVFQETLKGIILLTSCFFFFLKKHPNNKTFIFPPKVRNILSCLIGKRVSA